MPNSEKRLHWDMLAVELVESTDHILSLLPAQGEGASSSAKTGSSGRGRGIALAFSSFRLAMTAVLMKNSSLSAVSWKCRP